MPNPMTTRRRAAFLRRLGFKKSRLTFTRGTTTYHHTDGAQVCFPTSAPGGAPFMILSTPGRRFNFISNALHTGNLRSGAAERLRELRRDGYAVPSPDAPDAGTPEWTDALFIALAEAIAD